MYYWAWDKKQAGKNIDNNERKRATIKDCQGLEWPPGVGGKGMKGKGQGSK